MKSFFLFAISAIVFFSCNTPISHEKFNSILSESCIIINKELDNSIEGTYLRVTDISEELRIIETDLPYKSKEIMHNHSQWYIGWGSNKPLYDSGVENLAEIDSINFETKTIKIGKIVRGEGFPNFSQRIIFINKSPSGYTNTLKKPIIQPHSLWPSFKGESIHVGGIVFDSTQKQWVMIAQEADTSDISIYGAYSKDLINWFSANNGQPIMSYKNFKNCNWAGKDITGKKPQCPIISDIYFFNNTWHIFMYGYNSKGIRNIGLITKKEIFTENFNILPNAIILSQENSWNSNSSFCPKISKYKDGFVMAFNGVNINNEEQIGIAFSRNLEEWENSEFNPIISDHYGWRSSTKTSEPAYVYAKNDSIFLLISGAKKFKMGFWHHYFTHRIYKDVSGNVDDAQLGLYYTIDKGKTCKAHSNNPLFINDYSNPYENEHLGNNFFPILTDTAKIIIYQAKTSFEGNKYSLFIRSITIK